MSRQAVHGDHPFRRRAIRGSCGFLAVMATLAGGLGQIDFAPRTTTLLTAREVRTIDTGELGVSRPQGIAFLPEDGSLLVLGADTEGTAVLRVTRGGDRLSIADGPSVSRPATVAFDAASSKVRAIDDRSLLTLPEGSVARPGRGQAPADLAELRLVDPQGSVFDAAGGVWFVLDAATQTLVRAAIRGASVEEIERTSLRGLGATRLQGLALHPATGRLYVASPDRDLLFELDPDGTVHTTYSLAELGLVDARAMTFAPSTDATDRAERQHLFIADAGDLETTGEVKEVSLETGVTLAVTAPTVTAQLVQVIDTSQFSPASPDPAGIVYLPGPDRLEIADSEVDETTGAGYHGVNLWELTRTGTVTGTGSTWTGGAGFSKEPSGLGFDPATNTLLVSDDSNKRVWLVRTGPDARFGTADDVRSYINALAYGSDDTEDPVFDPSTGHIFFADGTNREVYRVDPVNGVFGDGNDLMTHFDVEQYGVSDPEGLASDPSRGTLLVGDRVARKIYEVTKAGDLVRIIDASQISGMRYLSGLAWAPASDGSGRTDYWIADRAIDNDSNANENDGKIFELRVDGGPAPSAPVAVGDSATTAEDNGVTVNVAANDSDPDGNLDPGSVTVSIPPASGTAIANGNGTVTYTPEADASGSVPFTYRICDTTSLCATATVTVTVTAEDDPPVAVSDTAATAVNTPVTVNVAANDSDPDGNLDPGSVTVTIPPPTGTAIANGNGTVTYTPEADATGSVTFTYRICDTTSLCATATATITLITPYYVSLASSTATVPGIAGKVGDEDIIVYRPSTGWAMFFDGSDVGIASSDISDFHIRADGGILMSFRSGISVPGLTGGPDGTLVDNSDIVLFTPTTTGAVTTGTFSFYFDGSDVGLEANAEAIDGLHELPDGTLAISTTGSLSVPGRSGADEDILSFSFITTGALTAGTWTMTYFDGSDVGLGSNDLDAVAFASNGDLLFSTVSDNTTPGSADHDINRFTGTYGPTTVGTSSLELALAPLGIATSNNVDGLSVDP